MMRRVRMMTVLTLLAALAVPLGVTNPPAASAAGTITVETKERGSEGPAPYACYTVEDMSNGTGNGAVGGACDGDGDGTTVVPVGDCDPCRVSQSLPEQPNGQPTDYLLEQPQTGAVGQTFTFWNFLKPYFVVTTVDARTGQRVPGACIGVQDLDAGGAPFAGCDGNAAGGAGDQDGLRDGRITTRRLPHAGNYRVNQGSPPPAGYLLGASADVVAEPAQTGESEAVELKLQPAPKIVIKTVDAKSGKRLKGACYAIAENVPGGALGSFCDGVKNGTVGDQDGVKNGVVVTRPLQAGRTYVIDQTTAPRGYRLVGPDKTTTTAAGTTSAVTFKNRPKG